MSLCKRNCKANCLYYKECGGCSLCEASLCSKNCNACFALCFQRKGIDSLLKDLNSTIKTNTFINLPYHIPILPDPLRKIPDELNRTIAVHGGNMFSRKGEHIYKKYREKGFQEALKIPSDIEGILEFYVKDRTLEGFWDKRKTIYPNLKNINFKAVIAPNFSVYEDAPRIDHLYNMKRSRTVYNELLDYGINSIPDISWYNRQDLEWWANEITHKNIKLIAFSFQVVDVGLKTSNIWRFNLLGFRYLCQNIPSDVHIIVAGVVSPFRVYEVISASGGRKIHILNQSAFVQSRRGVLSENRQSCPELSFDDLFKRNLEYFNNLYYQMNTSSLVSDLLTQSNENIKEYFLDPDRNKFNDKLSNSLIERIIRKRRIKIDTKEEKKCQKQEEAEQSQQTEVQQEAETAEQQETLQKIY